MFHEHSDRIVIDLLRARVRERLATGQLPTRCPAGSFAGRGSEKLCCLCDAPIVAADIEFELDFQEPDALGRTTIRLHSRCYDIWDAERVGTLRASNDGIGGSKIDSVANSGA